MRSLRGSNIKKRVSALSMAAMIVIEQLAYIDPMIAYSARSASSNGSSDFPAVTSSGVSASLEHKDQLVDNGDGTYTFTSDITSAYSYHDESGDRLRFQSDTYEFDKPGKYLIELWGGDGGDGSSLFPLSFKAGSGGKGGFVYGVLTVTPEDVDAKKKLYYEIGSKGLSQTRSIAGGGTGGIGGGAGDIAVFSVGAGGGGGGGAGAALHTLPGIFGGDGRANGGEGGTFLSSLSDTPNIKAFTSGTYYAGENGKTSGTKAAYVGQGGTDRPGELVESFIGFLEASSYPNDWQKSYHPDADRGIGGASNFRGGGGSSYVGAYSYFEENSKGSDDLFVERDGNTNADVGGAVVIRYLPDSNSDYAYLDNITVSGGVSEYFDIVSMNCTNNKYNASSKKMQLLNVSSTKTDNNFTVNGSVAPVPDGLDKGQAQDTLTVSITVRPKKAFFGGLNVPVFTGDFAVKDSDNSKNSTISYTDNVTHVNVPYNISITAKNSTKQTGDTVLKGDLFEQEIAYEADDPMQDFISGITYRIDDISANSFSDTITSADVSNGRKAFSVKATLVPKSGTAAQVGEAGNPTVTKTVYVRCISDSVLDVDGYEINAEKSLAYNETDDTYDLTVDMNVENQDAKSFSIIDPIESENVLDIVYNATSNLSSSNDYVSISRNQDNNSNNTKYSGTLQPGIYYVEVWGGDGGSGFNDPTNNLSSAVSNNTYGGYGGKGGFISGYVTLVSEKQLEIVLGPKGIKGDSSNPAGKGGKATYVNIGDESDDMTFVAGGGGGGSTYLKYSGTDQNSHMGYSGNDGYRIGGTSVYKGSSSNGNDYYDVSKYDGADAISVSISTGLNPYRRISNFNNNIASYFAKGGYSEIGSGVQTEIADIMYIDNGVHDITVDLGLYEYVNYFNSGIVSNYYISQWTNKSGDPEYVSNDDEYERVSSYKGTTKTSIGTTGAVKITRLGVRTRHNYGGTEVGVDTSNSVTLANIEEQIKNDYANANCYDSFTLTGNFTDYFDLQANSNYSIVDNIGSHQFALSNANVQSTASTTTNGYTQSTLPGYTFKKYDYVYKLKGNDSVTFKLKPINGFLGGNDVPLLNSATLTHHNNTVEDDDTKSIVADNATDFANVRLASETLADETYITVDTSPIFVEYGGTLSESDFTNTKKTFESSNLADDYARFTDFGYEPDLNNAITADTNVIVTAGLEPTSDNAARATVIDPVSRAERNFSVPVYVKYPITTTLTNVTAAKADGTQFPSSGEFFPTSVDDRDLTIVLSAVDGYDLPAADDVTVTGADASIEKRDGNIYVTIPRSTITGVVTITASGVQVTHKVHYMYEYYDPLSEQISVQSVVDTHEYKNGDFLEGLNFPNVTGAYPVGYDDYDWDFGQTEYDDDSGKYKMGQEDIYIIGTYVPITYKLVINYVLKDTDNQILETYTSPDRTQYHEDTDTFDIALTKGADFFIKSPDITGYVTDTPYVSGKVDNAFIDSLNETITIGEKTYKSKTINVYYEPNPDNVIVHFVKCDVRGVPIENDGNTITRITEAIGVGVDYDLESEILSNITNDEYEIIKRTRQTDTAEEEVTTVSGTITDADQIETYYVYYRAKPGKVTVEFYKERDDASPDKSKTCEVGREYGYNADLKEFDSLPRAVKDNCRLVGWETEDGKLIEDDTIVEGEDGTRIKLYAKWASMKVTIHVDYRYAENVENETIRGTEADTPFTKEYLYGQSYKIVSGHIPYYEAVPGVVEGIALEDKTEKVYYKDGSGEISIIVDVYSESSLSNTANAHKLKGGTFELYNSSGECISTKQNTDGSVTWTNVEVRLTDGEKYTVKCTDPPVGYAPGEIEVTVQGTETYEEMFLGKTKFRMPFAGSTPMTGYTVVGTSTMLLAVFLLFLNMRSKAEEKRIKNN